MPNLDPLNDRPLPRCATDSDPLLVADLFHPVGGFAVKFFHNTDMGHGRGRRGAVPMLFTRLKPDDIPRMNVLSGASPTLYRTRAGSGASNRGSTRTAPVKYSDGPLREGCEPFLLISIFLNSFLNFYIYSLSGVSASIPNYRPVIRSNSSGYRASCTVIFDAAFSISRRSSGVSSTLTAPIFSSKRDSFVVPGMGTIQDFWASNQARAIWAGVTLFLPQSVSSR